MAYLLVVTNLFCNHKCSYCIQQQSSLDVRLNPKKIDAQKLLSFLSKNRISRSLKLTGGETTLHPDFESMMEAFLKLYSKVIITTNLNGKWFENFDKALLRMKSWGTKVQWNSTYHPAWMDVNVYIERIRKMRDENMNLDQVTSTDTKELSDEIARTLVDANIGWRIQTFTGRNSEGRLLPETWADVKTQFPLLYDPKKYIQHYSEYKTECEDANYQANDQRASWVQCQTSRFLIGPDNLIYPCHRHLYAQDSRYACGTLDDVEMKNFKFPWSPLWKRWTLPCATKCNPCDFRAVSIKSLNRPVAPPLFQETTEQAL